ncbi:hypothetical protein EDD21DRAFT_228923 [Dissophora ornata]|nr:hypothetical protein EDD21DRAFT_228923 [Dissophora ornata]
MSLNERVCIVLHHLYLDGRCEHNNLFTPLIKKETVTSGLHASRAWCTEWRHQARVLRFRAKGYPSQSLKYIRHLHATWGRKSDAGGSALLSFRGSHPRINLHDAILLEVVLHLHSTYTHNPMGQVLLLLFFLKSNSQGHKHRNARRWSFALYAAQHRRRGRMGRKHRTACPPALSENHSSVSLCRIGNTSPLPRLRTRSVRA